MAENTVVAETKEAESRELVAKDFTEGMVVKIKQKERFGLTFPKDYNYTNEFMSAMLILQDAVDMNKKPVLQSCTRASIENALIDMVTDGLSMRKKQCYPVAYAGKLSCQPSVYGATCVARRYGLADINAEVVYEGDKFRYTITNGKKTIVEHTQEIDNIDNDKIKGAYAVAVMKDGTVKTEVMTIKQIKTAWKQGFGYKENGNGVHQKFTDQMAMKTVKNRLLKSINNTHSGFGEEDDYGEISHDEMLEQDVIYDIEQNANSEPFVVAESEATDGAAVEPEKVVENGENVPDFMKD
jgi:recombination protein RecT